MVLPFSRVLAHAIDSRMTSSGLMSTLARPVTPRRPKRVRAPRDSHTIEVLTVAPASTVLKGYTLTPDLMTAWAPTKDSSPRTTPSSQRTPWRRSQDRPMTQPSRRPPAPKKRLSWTTVRSSEALSPMRALAPITQYSPRTPPAPTWQLSPMMTGPRTSAVGSSSAPLPSQTPGRSANPLIWTATFSSRMSWWDRR